MTCHSSSETSKCPFVVNVRLGEVDVVGEDSVLYGWHVTKFTPHTCPIVSDTHKSIYSSKLLAHSLLQNVIDLTVPSIKECKALINDITFRPVSYKKVFTARNLLEEYVNGK